MKVPEGLHWREAWAWVAQNAPELLKSDEPDEERRSWIIRDRLIEAGVEGSGPVMIASRVASGAEAPIRPDGTVSGVPGQGPSSYPKSRRSERVDEDGEHGGTFVGIGYAYRDTYGRWHVVRDLATALRWSRDGKVYEYEGTFGGGYALGELKLGAPMTKEEIDALK